MKVRRVLLEIEVPYTVESKTVLVLASGALNHAKIRNQGRIVTEGMSATTVLPKTVKDVV